MAKANAETSFWGEMLQVRLFKPNQGRVVRQVTALAVAAIFVACAWRLHSTLLGDISFNKMVVWRLPFSSTNIQFPGGVLNPTIPVLLAVFGCWLAFRLVNWPTFANFLISVEAEMDKVSWASWDYLKRATAVVLVTMVVLGAYLFFCDVVWQQLFRWIGFLDIGAMS